MTALSDSFLSRIKSGILRSSLLAQAAQWISEHTFREGKPWSFKDHEFQIQIANEVRPIACRKPSQVGMSELQIRKALAFAALSRDKNLIYVLPSAKFGSKFCKGRVDPVIAGSPTLKALRNPGADNSEQKQIGSSFIYISGASNASQAISVPAEVVMFDEYNFCNQTVTGDYESRLGHAENGGNSSKFSTPTLADFGVSKEIKFSTWARYVVKCPHCSREVAPIFSEHVRIPGFDRPFAEFNRDVLESGKYNIDLAYIACPRCAGRLDESFADPTQRRWVEQFPGREVAGYDIRPFDLIKYNPTPRVLRRIKRYSRLASFYNFALGEDYSGSDVEIFPTIVQQCTDVVPNSMPRSRQVQMGVDVGNTCHCVVGEEVDGEVIVYEVFKLYATDGDLETQILKAAHERNVDILVIDAQPEKNMSRNVRDKILCGDAWPAYYVDTGEKNNDFWTIKADKGHVTIHRDTACGDFVTDVNAGRWHWPICQEMDTVRFQLTQMKKLQQVDESDAMELQDASAVWSKVSPSDHYFHSCIYLLTAIKMANSNTNGYAAVAPIAINSVSFKTEEPESIMNVLVKRVRR